MALAVNEYLKCCNHHSVAHQSPFARRLAYFFCLSKTSIKTPDDAGSCCWKANGPGHPAKGIILVLPVSAGIAATEKLTIDSGCDHDREVKSYLLSCCWDKVKQLLGSIDNLKQLLAVEKHGAQ